MVTDLIEQRRGILKYILYHYDIDNKETVWILNYLKDHSALQYCRFTSAVTTTKGITLTDNFKLLFKYDDLILTEADVIFNVLNEIDEPFYFYTTFNDARIQSMREYEWLLNQMDRRALPDEIVLEPQLKSQLQSVIETRIDLSLMMNERQDFIYYTTLLNKLEED
ncbi:YpiB family protein [Macrococcus hajekii]|nr:YpiB family protein [Macrococcus hajekii]